LLATGDNFFIAKVSTISYNDYTRAHLLLKCLAGRAKTMDNNYIITIGREYGSGGLDIGMKVAEMIAKSYASFFEFRQM